MSCYDMKQAAAVHPLTSGGMIDGNGSVAAEVCQWQVKPEGPCELQMDFARYMFNQLPQTGSHPTVEFGTGYY